MTLKLKFLVAVIGLMTFGSGGLKADSYFDWTDSGPGFSASGTLVATDIGNDVYVADSGTGIATGSIFGGSETLTLFAGAPNGSLETSPAGLFYFDNELFPGASQDQLLDVDGLLFTASNGGGEFNIWGNGAGTAYSTWTGVNGGYSLENNSSRFTLVATQPPAPTGVSEASSLVLLGTGLLGMMSISLKRKLFS